MLSVIKCLQNFWSEAKFTQVILQTRYVEKQITIFASWEPFWVPYVMVTTTWSKTWFKYRLYDETEGSTGFIDARGNLYKHPRAKREDVYDFQGDLIIYPIGPEGSSYKVFIL